MVEDYLFATVARRILALRGGRFRDRARAVTMARMRLPPSRQ